MNEITLGQLAPTKSEIDQITETIRLELEDGRINQDVRQGFFLTAMLHRQDPLDLHQ